MINATITATINKIRPILIFTILSSCADTEIRKIELEDTDTYCSIENNVLKCPDGSSQELLTGATIYSIIRPCGDESKFQEILFRLSTGQIIAVFDTDTKDKPQQTRLVILEPGSYVTTDQSNPKNRCKFKVLTNNEGVEVVEPGIEEVLK